MRATLAVAAVVFLAGCGGGVPRGAAGTPAAIPPSSSAAVAAAAPSSPAAPGAAFCGKLRASPKTVRVVYAEEVERQVGLASGDGSVTPEAIQAAQTLVALWITISCPQFAYLAKQQG